MLDRISNKITIFTLKSQKVMNDFIFLMTDQTDVWKRFLSSAAHSQLKFCRILLKYMKIFNSYYLLK